MATPLLLKALSDNGRADIAFRLMNQREIPGFGYVMDDRYSCLWEATEAERWQGVQSGIIFHKRTGNEFLDLFASMVHHYMNHDPVFYAKKLGVSRIDLSGCLRVLTGVTTDEWLEAYRWVAIRDVLLHTDWPLGEVATKMGYSSVKTFSRAFIERVGIPPSHWRAKYKGND